MLLVNTPIFFLLSLPACYWTPWPSVLLFLVVIIEGITDAAFKWRDMQLNSDIAKDVEKLKSDMNAVQLKLGFRNAQGI